MDREHLTSKIKKNRSFFARLIEEKFSNAYSSFLKVYVFCLCGLLAIMVGLGLIYLSIYLFMVIVEFTLMVII